MKNIIGILKESKYPGERYAPLTPEQVRALIQNYDVNVIIQPSDKRYFSNEAYEKAGAIISKDLSQSNIILGIREIPLKDLRPGGAYCLFFNHIKAQKPGIRMLRRILEVKSTFIDYELIKDEQGKPIIFFGKYAGSAGMINSLWVLGQRLVYEGINNPFKDIKQSCEYSSLEEAMDAIKRVGENIKQPGLPAKLKPLICGFFGHGGELKEAQAIYDLLPVEEISVKRFFDFINTGKFSNKTLYKVGFTKADIYRMKEKDKNQSKFNLDEPHKHPENYSSRLEDFIPHLTILMNGIPWQPGYPRLLTKAFLRTLYENDSQPRLRIIADITADIRGPFDVVVKSSDARNPVYVYEPLTDGINDGWEGNGPVVIAVDKLSAEFPMETSHVFGEALMPFIPRLAKIDFSLPLEELSLPPQFQNAVIAHKGRLTPKYKYLNSYLK